MGRPKPFGKQKLFNYARTIPTNSQFPSSLLSSSQFGPINWNPSPNLQQYCSWDQPSMKNCNYHYYEQGEAASHTSIFTAPSGLIHSDLSLILHYMIQASFIWYMPQVQKYFRALEDGPYRMPSRQWQLIQHLGRDLQASAKTLS